ncbi:reverse transcriptase [Cucumis melo var. makuwa]|uniref:Reverse transcriptase n=1 Tax=Cucumis melo var. makuwa TaxID=1194695 RepID=A0A5A7U8Z8_CUCMM|nr:reverse transcriptase [Cucumis melo var. makuwa]TYK08486.1 reverse transcriptase [Cucumis melo var. makuwa]
MLEIGDLPEKEALFQFKDGLKDWAKIELDYRNVQTLDDAIAAAETLVDYSAQSKGKKLGPEKYGGKSEKTKSFGRKDGGKALNALVAKFQEVKQVEDALGPQIGSMQQIGVMKKETTTEHKGLLYGSVRIEGKEATAMFDTGASHNFMDVQEAKRLGLKFKEETETVKVVNAKEQVIHGITKGVLVKIGDWQKRLDFSILPMDDFHIVLGLGFFDKVVTLLDSNRGTLSIIDGLMTTILIRRGKPVKMLSALQFIRGVLKNECYVATMKAVETEEAKSEEPPVPDNIQKVLDEYKDIMPEALPKKLPPRREVDHELEYKPGRANVVADALSRKAELSTIMTSMPTSDFLERIKEGMQHDELAKNLLKLAKEGKIRRHPVCQQDKGEQQLPAGLLEPLLIAEKPWDSVTMDFIVALPKSHGFGTIMVVVDKFSKYATFIPCPPDVKVDEAARLFFKNIVKLWGIPKSIISDRDPCFTGKFWQELFKLMGTDLNFSTSFHPQSDGQTERINALLEQYLSESTGKSPFEIIMNQQPNTPNALIAPYEGPNPSAFNFAKQWHGDQDISRACLEKAARRMKKWADKRRRPKEYEIGEKTEFDRKIKEILAERKIRRRGVPSYSEYLILWEGLPESEASWEREDVLWKFQQEIEKFKENATGRCVIKWGRVSRPKNRPPKFFEIKAP